MTRFSIPLLCATAAWTLVLAGCNKEAKPATEPAAAPAATGDPAAPPAGAPTAAAAAPAAPTALPVFSLAWSEYPSWSTFGVAHELGLLDGKEGAQGEIEKRFQVDIVLRQADYDPCIAMYASGQVDAAALTNMDALNPALGRPSVAILPTSRSHGADALLVPKDITDVEQLKGKKVYGLEKSVSQYLFERALQELGKNPADFTFANMDPAAAATAMQQKSADHSAIVVWNPFVLSTLAARPDVHVLVDSTKIPGEIVDLIIVAQASLDKPGGDAFAKAVAATFYEVSRRIENPGTRNATLVELGRKFSSLNAQQMETVVGQTQFYKTPEDAKALFNGPELVAVMAKVVAFCEARGVVTGKPSVAFGPKDKAPPGTHLRFDPSYL